MSAIVENHLDAEPGYITVRSNVYPSLYLHLDPSKFGPAPSALKQIENTRRKVELREKVYEEVSEAFPFSKDQYEEDVKKSAFVE